MGVGQDVSGWLTLGLQAGAAVLSHLNHASLPAVAEGPDLDGVHGHVTIAVPARDEASRLPELLRSLGLLRYPDREIVVVDDDSRDGTGELARAMGARVIRVETLPPGWSGKSHACQIAADSTDGEWLLFTDADTVHAPDSLGWAVAMAVRESAGLLSLLARQRCETFWERLLVPYAYALYFVGAGRANQPGGPAIANGQYMLFRRETYNAIGGHARVRGSIVEDVELARAAARHGARVILARGDEQLEVRMYEGLASLWQGFGKNAFRFVAASPRGGSLTVAATLAFSLALPQALRTGSWPRRLGLLLVPAAALLPWVRRSGVPARYALLHPLAAAVFQLLALDSMRRVLLRRGTPWKGRRY